RPGPAVSTFEDSPGPQCVLQKTPQLGSGFVGPFDIVLLSFGTTFAVSREIVGIGGKSRCLLRNPANQPRLPKAQKREPGLQAQLRQTTTQSNLCSERTGRKPSRPDRPNWLVKRSQ